MIETRTYTRASQVTLTLSEEDRFKAVTSARYRGNREYDFLVTTIRYSSGDNATLRGPGILKNGEGLASVNREDTILLADLDPKFLVALLIGKGEE